MTQNIIKKEKKAILFLSVILLFTLILSSCDLFGGIGTSPIDTEDQIVVNYNAIKLSEVEATVDLQIYSIGQAKFIGENIEYKYYDKGVLISQLSKTIDYIFKVTPSYTPGLPGPITKINSLPLYYRDVLDYAEANPEVTKISCVVTLLGTDGAGHTISKSITINLPGKLPDDDFTPPIAVIKVYPGTTGTAPFTVQFDASQSMDNVGIADYSWDFGNGKTGTGVLPEPQEFNEVGNYFVKLTVTDHNGNSGYAVITITVIEDEVPKVAKITLYANPQQQKAGQYSDITAQVLNTLGEAVADDTTVNFLANSGTLTDSTSTTASGFATIRLKLATDMQNGQTAVVTATVGSVSASVTVTCIDPDKAAQIIVRANPKFASPDGTSSIQATVLNLAGVPIIGESVNFSTTGGGSLSSTSENTSVNGTVITTLTLTDMRNGDVATVTAQVGGLSDSVDVTCIDKVHTITVTATPSQALPNGKSTIQAIVLNSVEAPIPNVTVNFYSNDGTLSSISGITLSNGKATTILTLTDMMDGQIATVLASVGSVTGSVDVTCKEPGSGNGG